MDVSAVVLHKLLSEQSLDIYSKLKLIFIDPAYSTLFTLICKHYEKYGKVPSFGDLELTIREGQAAKVLATIKLTEVPEVTPDIALNALIDQYTQSETINLLEKFIPVLPLCDSNEIKDHLASIALTIEEKTFTSENIFSMSDLCIFHKAEDILNDRTYLGFNNTFDSQLSGIAKQELLLLGGKRGSGKSLVCSNIFVSQYELGNSCQYFTIEMTAREINERNLAILANVSHSDLKKGTLSKEDVIKVAKVRANMFEGAEEVFEDFLKHNDRYKFEETLVRNFKLKPNNQMIIVDDRELTISTLDLNISKAKARFGDSLLVVVVDYINQIVIDGNHNKYDWQPQVEVATKLKNLARKHDVAIVSPYQIDDNGQTRFAKGILDPADIALLLDAHKKEDCAISFDTTKIRSDKELSFTSPINWDTLRIYPTDIDRPRKASKTKEAKSDTNEEGVDLPWEL